MNFLTKVMNTTIILCTATQPAYDSTAIHHRISYGGKNGEEADIVDLSREEKEVLLLVHCLPLYIYHIHRLLYKINLKHFLCKMIHFF